MIHVAGTVPFTTIDFPNHLAGVVFFQGCPLRCPFCHNPDLQCVHEGTQTWEEVLGFFEKRTRQLDGVVLSGGEPLMQRDIEKIIADLKGLGFKIAVHTAGVYPKVLQKIIATVDWGGLDVKAPWEKYPVLCGCGNMAPYVQESIAVLNAAGIPYEARTTCDPRHLTKGDIERLTDDLAALGVKTYAMQKYRTFDKDANPPDDSAINAFFNDEEWLAKIRGKFDVFLTR